MLHPNAESRAEKSARQAKRELYVYNAIPCTALDEPLIVTHKGHFSIIYRTTDPADVLHVMEVFARMHRPALVSRASGWAPSVRREEREGEELVACDIFAWVTFDAGTNWGTDMRFCFFACLLDGTPLEVQIRLESNHADTRARFENLRPRAVKHFEYRPHAPAFLAQCAQVFGARGAPDGTSAHWKGIFMTRDCLAYALETLEAKGA